MGVFVFLPLVLMVVATALPTCLEPAGRWALFAQERAHLATRHHRLPPAVRPAARANPFPRPLRTAVSCAAERWADEDAGHAVGSSRVVARAIGKAALVSAGSRVDTSARRFTGGDARRLRRVGPGAAPGGGAARAAARGARAAVGVHLGGAGRVGSGRRCGGLGDVVGEPGRDDGPDSVRCDASATPLRRW